MLKTGVTIKCELIKRGVVELLKKLNKILLTFQCSSINETLELSKKYDTDILILDYKLIYSGQTRMINQLKEKNPGCKLFVYLDHTPDHSYIEIKNKVYAFLHKDISYDDFKKMINSINRDEDNYFENREFINDYFTDAEAKSMQSDLTKREIEILQCMVKGMNNKKIAEDLYISDRTVKNINYKIYKKLSVNNRTHAVVKALNKGMISIS